MKVRIPTPLRSYTANAPVVDAAGSTVDQVLEDLDRRYPGLRFRVVDEQGRLRPHMRVFLNDQVAEGLSATVTDDDTVTLMQALSGG